MKFSILALIAFPIAAQADCADREAVIERLQGTYGETHRAYALNAGQNLTDFYVNPETGTWTITVTKPDGPTCIVAYGRNWTDLAHDEPA